MDIKTLPGCCGVEVVFALSEFIYDPNKTLHISPDERGFAEVLAADIQDETSKSLTLATTSSENAPSVIAGLQKVGFRKLLTFRNESTGNRVTLWGRGKFTLPTKPVKKRSQS